ncbi:MAG: ankyrin repeat domain-containing protein [Thermoanaerobaculia bacterium]
MTRCTALVLLLAVPSALAAKPPKAPPPSTESLILQAKIAVRDGTAEPERDLAPMLERLRTTTKALEQRDLIEAIEDLGRHDSANSAAVKAYLREAAPPVLLAVARSKTDGIVRCNALLLLRTLNVGPQVLDEAIALAAADTSPDQKAIRFHGRLLANWKETHPTNDEPPVPSASGSSAKEKAALDLLRRRHERVSADNLGQAASRADAEVVAALLDAGIDPNSTLAAGMSPLSFAAGAGCVFDRAGLAARLATIDVLLQHGADLARKENNGSTVLISAVDCPLPVAEKLLAAGAKVDAGNEKVSPLEWAFIKGRWDIAALYVAHGARMSKAAIDKLFFEKPTDPEKLALIRRATAPARK